MTQLLIIQFLFIILAIINIGFCIYEWGKGGKLDFAEISAWGCAILWCLYV